MSFNLPNINVNTESYGVKATDLQNWILGQNGKMKNTGNISIVNNSCEIVERPKYY